MTAVPGMAAYRIRGSARTYFTHLLLHESRATPKHAIGLARTMHKFGDDPRE